MLLERVERQALADRQARMTAAALLRNGDLSEYTPLSIDSEIAAFDEWLVSDPADTPEARERELSRRYLEEVA